MRPKIMASKTSQGGNEPEANPFGLGQLLSLCQFACLLGLPIGGKASALSTYSPLLSPEVLGPPSWYIGQRAASSTGTIGLQRRSSSKGRTLKWSSSMDPTRKCSWSFFG